MKESIFMDRIRDIFSVLDIGVYKLISIFNNTIEDLTHITIISNDTLNDMAMKVYGLIALFMIFKISFSLINYIVDPDIISDKAKGGGTLIKNIIITFALIVTVPFAFDLLYEAQNAILSDHIIEKYLLNADTEKAEFTFSMSDECSGINATTSDAGDYIGLMAFKPFFQPNVSKDSDDWDNIKQLYCNADATGGTGNASVKNMLANQAVYSAPHGNSIEHYYVIDYTIFISTIIGIVIALLFLSFCFDIAVRTVKLQFLELIAPVPIISYIDPDSSKNGMFKKWTKEVMNTWLSLFLRLATIDFAIYIIGMLADIDLAGNNLWLKLLIIIGTLIFAKQLPKLLENIFGIKLGENFTLNPLKKVGNEALGGKLVTGAAVAGVGLAASGIGQSASNMYAFGRDKWNLNKAMKAEKMSDEYIKGDHKKFDKMKRKYDAMDAGRLFTTSTGGLIGGARRGAVSGFKSGQGGKLNVGTNLRSDLKGGNLTRNNRTAIRNFNEELKYQRDHGMLPGKTKAEQEQSYKQQRYTWFERNVEENLDREAGVKNEYGGYGFYDKKISDLERKIGNNNQQEEAIRTAAASYCANKGIDFTKVLKDYETKGASSGYTDLDVQLKSIIDIDNDTKALKADQKGFKEMLDARQTISKDK